MERPERSLIVDGTAYTAIYTGVTDTIDDVTHMAVRFTDPQTDDHFHVRYRVPQNIDPAECFAHLPEAELEAGLRDALRRASMRPVR